MLDVAPGPNGVAVLNGLQIISRGTSPPRLLAAGPPAAAPASTNLLFREIRYEGKVSDTEARFAVTFDVESMTTNEISAPLFEGDVALVSPELPDALRIVSQGRQTRLFCTAPGSYPVKLDLIAKITKAEPWNQISFVGPPAAIASVTASASAPGVEMQLLSGTQLDPEKKATSKVSGFLGSDRTLTMRWQSKAAEVTRKSLVTVDTAASAQITPTVIKFTTALRYEILQAAVPRLTVALPASPRADPHPGRANPRLAGQAGRRAPGAHHRVHQAGRESLHRHAVLRADRRDHAARPPRSSRPSRSKWSASPARSR